MSAERSKYFRTTEDLMSGKLSSDASMPGVHHGQVSSSIFIAPTNGLGRTDLNNVDSARLVLCVDEYSPGGGSDPHTHEFETASYVISGLANVRVENEERQVSTGGAFHVPTRAVHSFANIGQDTLRLVVINCFENELRDAEADALPDVVERA